MNIFEKTGSDVIGPEVWRHHINRMWQAAICVTSSCWNVEIVVERAELFFPELDPLLGLLQVGDVLDQVD